MRFSCFTPFGGNQYYTVCSLRTVNGGRAVFKNGDTFNIRGIQTIESGNPLNFSFANSPHNYYPEFAGARRPDLVERLLLFAGLILFTSDGPLLDEVAQLWPLLLPDVT